MPQVIDDSMETFGDVGKQASTQARAGLNLLASSRRAPEQFAVDYSASLKNGTTPEVSALMDNARKLGSFTLARFTPEGQKMLADSTTMADLMWNAQPEKVSKVADGLAAWRGRLASADRQMYTAPVAGDQEYSFFQWNRDMSMIGEYARAKEEERAEAAKAEPLDEGRLASALEMLRNGVPTDGDVMEKLQEIVQANDITKGSETYSRFMDAAAITLGKAATLAQAMKEEEPAWRDMPEDAWKSLRDVVSRKTGIDFSDINLEWLKKNADVHAGNLLDLFGIGTLSKAYVDELTRSSYDDLLESIHSRTRIDALARQMEAMRGQTTGAWLADATMTSLRWGAEFAVASFLTGGWAAQGIETAFANAGMRQVGPLMWARNLFTEAGAKAMARAAGYAAGEAGIVTLAGEGRTIYDSLVQYARQNDGFSYVGKDGNLVTLEPEKVEDFLTIFMRNNVGNFMEAFSENLSSFLWQPGFYGKTGIGMRMRRLVGNDKVFDTMGSLAMHGAVGNGVYEMLEEMAVPFMQRFATVAARETGLDFLDFGQETWTMGLPEMKQTAAVLLAQMSLMQGLGIGAGRIHSAMHAQDAVMHSLRGHLAEMGSSLAEVVPQNADPRQIDQGIRETGAQVPSFDLTLDEADKAIQEHPQEASLLGVTPEAVSEARKEGRRYVKASGSMAAACLAVNTHADAMNDIMGGASSLGAGGGTSYVGRAGDSAQEVNERLNSLAGSAELRREAMDKVRAMVEKAYEGHPNFRSNAFNAGNLLASVIDMFMQATGESADEILKTIELRLQESPEDILTPDTAYEMIPASARSAAGLDLSEEQNRDVIQSLADLMGVEVRYATGQDLVDRARADGISDADRIRGWYSRKDAQTGKDVIYINPTAAVRLTFGHELLHRVRAVSPEIHAQLHDVLTNGGNLSDRLKAFMDGTRRAYAEERQALPEDKLQEECDADLLGAMMQDPTILQEIARELERRKAGMGAQFIQSFLETVDRILETLSKLVQKTPLAATLYADYTRKRAQVASLLADFSERYREAQPGEEGETRLALGGNYDLTTTPNFQAWFGDWRERDIYGKLHGGAIARTTKDAVEVKEGEKGVIDAAKRWVRDNIHDGAHTEIGTVNIDVGSMKEDFGHTRYQNKLATLPLLKPVLENGEYLGHLPDFSGESIDNHYFAAPVEIDGERKILFIRVVEPLGKPSSLHVHEVFTEDEIKRSNAMLTNAADKNGRRVGKASDLYRTIIALFMRAAPEASKAVDSNGNPLVVWRRDNENINVYDFDKTQKTDAGWLGKGFYFYGNKREAEAAYGYGKNLRGFYLNAKNPYFITDEEVRELANKNDAQLSAEFTQQLIDEGYDSVYYNGDLRQEWVVFDSNQMKLADPVTYDDEGKPIPVTRRFSGKNDVRLSIGNIWHGTSADFDAPSLHYVGTGEGTQMEGYGIYGASLRNLGEIYAQADVARKGRSQTDDAIVFRGRAITNRASDENYLADIRLDDREVEIGVPRALQAMRSAVMVGDYKGAYFAALSMAEQDAEDGVPDADELVDWLEDHRGEFKAEHVGNRHLYRMTFFTNREGEGEANLIDWHAPLSPEIRELVSKAMEEGLSEEQRARVALDAKEGGEFYRSLAKVLGSPKAASEFLDRAGVDGVRYMSDDWGVKAWDYVAFNPAHIRVDEHIRYSLSRPSTALQLPAGNSLANTQASVVEILSSATDADVAARLAEWAYARAHAVMAAGLDKSGDLAASMEMLDEWLERLPNPHAPGTAAYEDYKRGVFGKVFQRYLFDGKVASIADPYMRDTFRQLKQLVRSAYRSVELIVPQLPLEASMVFDQMLAAEDVVEGQTELHAFLRLMRDQAEKGLNAENGSANALAKLFAKARAEMVEKQEKALAKIADRLLPGWREAAEKIADGIPAYAALKEIAAKGGLDMQVIRPLLEDALSREDAEGTRFFGKEGEIAGRIAGELGRRGAEAQSGQPSAGLAELMDIAQRHGWRGDVAAMLQDVARGKTRAEFVEGQIEGMHKAWLDSGEYGLDEDAMANEAMIQALEQLELNLTLNRGRGDAVRSRRWLANWAAQELGRKEVRQILEDNMVKSATGNLNEMVKELGAKTPDEAKLIDLVGKTRQNLAILKELAKARRTAEKAIAKTRRALKSKGGAIDGEYKDAIGELAFNWGFTQTPPRNPGTLARILNAARAEAKAELGAEMDGWSPLMVDTFDTGRDDYTKMSLQDFNVLAGVLDYLEYAGRQKTKGEKADYMAYVHSLVDGLLEDMPASGFKYTAYADEKKSAFRGHFASISNLNKLMGQIGPHGSQVLLDLAGTAESDVLYLQENATRRLDAALGKFLKDFNETQAGAAYRDASGSPCDLAQYLNSILPMNLRQDADWRGYRDWTGGRGKANERTAGMMLMLALYLGSASGRQRVMSGYGWGAQPSTDENGNRVAPDYDQLDAAFQPFFALFTDAQLEAVNEIWAVIGGGELTSSVAEAHRKATHTTLAFVPPAPFTVDRSASGRQGVAMDGGYVPLHYLFSDRGPGSGVDAPAENNAARIQNHLTPSSVILRHAEIKAPAPVTLDVNVLYQHIADNAHYATHRVPMGAMLHVVADRRFKEAYVRTFGQEQYDSLVKDVQRVANPKAKAGATSGAIMNTVKTLFFAKAFFGNVKSAMKTTTSATVGVDELGRFWGEAWLAPGESRRFALENSALVRNRLQYWDPHMSELMAMHGRSGWAKAQGAMMKASTILMRMGDGLVVGVNWTAAYNKAVAEGKSQHDAVVYADTFIGRTQGSSREIDKTEFQSQPYSWLLAPFMGITSAMYNETALDWQTKKGGDRLAATLANLVFPSAMSAVIAMVFAPPKGRDEEDRLIGTAAWRSAVRAMLLNPFSGMPYVRELADFVADQAAGGTSRDPFNIGAVSYLQDIAKDIGSARKAYGRGDGDYGTYLMAKAVSDAFGIPFITAYQRLVKSLENMGVEGAEALDAKERLKD